MRQMYDAMIEYKEMDDHQFFLRFGFVDYCDHAHEHDETTPFLT